MSQYLSHLANLALNRLDVVQPRVASRFESQEEANGPSLMPLEPSQKVGHDAATFDDQQIASTRTSSLQQPDSFAHRNADIQPTTTSSGARADNGSQHLAADPFQSPQISLQPAGIAMPRAMESSPMIETVEANSIFVAPEPPALKPAKSVAAISETAERLAEDAFKEELIETSQPLLKPIKVGQAPVAQRESDRQSPNLDSTARKFGAAEFVNRPRNNDYLAEFTNTQQITQNSEIDQPGSPQPSGSHTSVFKDVGADSSIVKTAAVKPESIRVQPSQAEFNTMLAHANQPRIAPPIEVTPPTINVSIGRIEIRASQTNSPSVAKTRPTNATMSLDDYLKQRNGEKP